MSQANPELGAEKSLYNQNSSASLRYVSARN